MKEITVLYAKQLKHYFCMSLNMRHLLMPCKKTVYMQLNIAFYALLCFANINFLCFPSAVRSNACLDSLLRIFSGTRNTIFLFSDGEPEFLGSDTDDVITYIRIILCLNFSSGIFSFAMQYST